MGSVTNPTVDLKTPPTQNLFYVATGVAIFASNGSPNNVLIANAGSLALDVTTGNAYLKTTDDVASGWVIIGSGGAGNPSPPNFSVQFNSGGVFLGDAEFTYNPTTNTLTLTGILNVTTVNATNVNATNGTFTNLTFTNPPVLTGFTPGSVLFTGAAGEIDEDAVNFIFNNSTNELTIANIAASAIRTVALTLIGAPANSVFFAGALSDLDTDTTFLFDPATKVLSATNIHAPKFVSTPLIMADASPIVIDVQNRNRFEVSSAGSRTLSAPLNPDDGQQISFRWKNIHASSQTLTLAGGAGGFRYNGTITVLPATAASKDIVFTALYDATDSLWDVLGFVNDIA